MIVVKQEFRCDECGRHNIKVKRRHKGLKFCASCYRRTFVKTNCTKCSKQSRIYKHDSTAVCLPCERKRPCIRCGKQKYKIGNKTPEGPICASCIIYLKAPKPCNSCGQLSIRLSSYSKYGVDKPICPKCSNKYRASCERCRKHRDLSTNESGERICKTCSIKGYLECPKCSTSYPAGYGKRCEKCYYLELFRKRREKQLAVIQSRSVKELFNKYSVWILQTYELRKAVLVIKKHISFFKVLDTQWQQLPSKNALLNHFGVEGLRAFRIVTRFLSASENCSFTRNEKSEFANLQKVINITTSFIGEQEALEALERYQNKLLKALTDKKLKSDSARMYVQNAKKLLAFGWPTTNHYISLFLTSSPGQRANIGGFITFINKVYGLNLQLPKDPKKYSKAGETTAKNALIKRLKELDNPSYDDTRVLSLSLRFFHGVPNKYLRNADKCLVEPCSNGGFQVRLETTEYWLPNLELRLARPKY